MTSVQFTENRNGYVEYRITINNKSAYSGDVRCEGRISPNYPYSAYASSSKASTISLSSGTKTASCVVKIPFSWQGVDVSTLINGSVGIDSTWCDCVLNSFSVDPGVPDFAYPTNGSTAVVNVAVDI